MNRESLEQLKSPGITAEDVLVVMANRDLETARCLDWWEWQERCTPFTMWFLTADGELVEELDDLDYHDDDWWEQNWGGRA